MKKKSFIIVIPLFEIEVSAVLGAGQISSDSGPCAGETVMDEDGDISVTFAERSPSPDLIAHEALHVVQFLERKVCTKFDDETAAYLLQFIVEAVHRKCGAA